MAACLCGCGNEVREGKRYVRGHHLKNRANNREAAAVPVVRQADAEIAQSSAIDRAAKLRIHIYPSFGDLDKGDGGIRRVVEGQIKHLPKFGIEIVETATEADVIACHAITPTSYVNLYPQKTFVSMCHGLYWSEYADWQNWALKANAEVIEAIRISDAITAPSEWVANAIRRHASRPVTVIPHGIDTEDWQGEESLGYVLWNKTRPDPVCDPEPVNQVAARMPNTQFVSTFVATDAPNIRVTGKLTFEESKKLIQRAGVYLCTTRETFGIGTLEALSCGVPVVGFAYGGQKDIIEHGVDGWLAKPGDFEGLVEGIDWALSHREELEPRCRAKAAIFNWESAAAQYAALFTKTYENKNKPQPRTSIIVTAYNLDKYLPDTLHSIQAQTDQNWECIIVDDASPDTCGEIADSWVAQDSRFKVIHNEKNVYLAEARNVGIRASVGRYVLPIDADDMLVPHTVQILADALDKDKKIHIAYGNVYFTEEDGRTPVVYRHNFPPGHSAWPFQFNHEQQLMQRNLLPYSSMYRREAWEYTGGYRRRCKTAEDADFWSRLSSYGFRPQMVTTEDTLIYRNREGSMSRIQEAVEWASWFPWSKISALTPAAAFTKDQLPIPSLDPVIISVVIPVGPGHEKIFTDAVDSVDAQTFRQWECIVVNDTGKPLPTELPVWVRVIETTGQTGAAHARNTGITASRGKLYLPLDADDYLEPEALEIMFAAHQESHDVIYSDFWQSDMEGKEISIHQCDDYNPYLLTGDKRVVNGQMREGMIHTVTALTPKEHWEKVGGYDESLPAWEDWDFQLSLANIGVCSRRVAAPLFFYRKHTGFRREENYEFFNRSKEAILKKWGMLWEGGVELMACGSCGSRKTFSPSGSSWVATSAARSVASNGQGKNAVLVEYIGERQGNMPYRGPSKTTYWFSRDDNIRYVLEEDVATFAKYPGDFVINRSPAMAPDSPLLTATGQSR